MHSKLILAYLLSASVTEARRLNTEGTAEGDANAAPGGDANAAPEGDAGAADGPAETPCDFANPDCPDGTRCI